MMDDRLSQILNIDVIDGVKSFLDRYQPEMTMDMVHPQGIKFEDELNNKVVVVSAKIEDRYFHFAKANADVFVLVQEAALLGWGRRTDFIDNDTEWMMPVGALNKMPKKGLLKFAQECRHMGYFGGYRFNADHFTCFGCGKEMV